MENNNRNLIFGWLAIIIFAALLVISWIYPLRKFHLVSTFPSTRSFSSGSTNITLNFNKLLSSQNAHISSTPSITGTTQTNNKSLVISFTQPLEAGRTYVITVDSLSDTSGDTIHNKKISFTPRYIPYSQLSQIQQQESIQGQTYHPPSKNNIVFTNFSDLMTYGPTSAQVSVIEQAIYNFSNNARSATLTSGSIKTEPHDPSSLSDALDFKLSIDSVNYSARVVYSSLTQARLILSSPSSGKVLFDSK